MSQKKKTGVIGGVCMAHAPQFLTLPESEDKKTVNRVKDLAKNFACNIACCLFIFAVFILSAHFFGFSRTKRRQSLFTHFVLPSNNLQ